MGPLIYGVFSFQLNTEVLHDLLLVESTYLELWIQRNHLYRSNYKFYVDFQLHRGSATLTLPPCVQLYTKNCESKYLLSIYYVLSIVPTSLSHSNLRTTHLR